MSDNLDKLGDFGIQDTVEAGAGDTQLLNDLLAPETASGDPDDVEPIVNEIDSPKQEVNNDPPRGKDITPPKSADGKTDEEKQTGESLIADFLSDVPEEEEAEKEVTSKKETKAKDTPVEEDVEEDLEEEEPKEGNQFTALANDLFILGVFTKENEEEVSINTPE